jgi:hypothetical protein
VTRSGWINALDLLRERETLRTEVAHLRAENERLRSALVEDVLAEVHDGSGHAAAASCASSSGC